MAGPAALFEAHMQAELDADLQATMATMVADPHLLNLGSGTGGTDRQPRSSWPPRARAD